MGLNADDVVLIFAGGEWVRKGLDLAIRALCSGPARNKKAKLFIAGRRSGKRDAQGVRCGVRSHRPRHLWWLSKDVPMEH